MAQLCIVVPDEMKKDLEKIAQKEERKLSFIVRKVLQDFLDKKKEED